MVILQQHPGLVFVLVGPGGVGKNALMRNILERNDPNLSQLATATTRAARIGEQHGKQRLFVTHEEFRRMIAHDELVEHEEVHTGDFYGVPRASIEGPIAAHVDLIADIDMRGGESLRMAYPNNIVLIFIAPPGETPAEMLRVLKERLQTRDATSEQIDQRLRRAPEELDFALQCDHVIINNEIETATNVLQGVIYAERSRRNVYNLRALENLPHEQFSYAASVVPIYNDEVLVSQRRLQPASDRLLHGELPHHSALRILHQQLNIQAVSGQFLRSQHSEQSNDFVSPINVHLRGDQYHRQIVFEFIYIINERIVPPDGWVWIPSVEAKLPVSDLAAERTKS